MLGQVVIKLKLITCNFEAESGINSNWGNDGVDGQLCNLSLHMSQLATLHVSAPALHMYPIYYHETAQ